MQELFKLRENNRNVCSKYILNLVNQVTYVTKRIFQACVTRIVLVKSRAFERYPYECYFNDLLTTGSYILSVKVMTKYSNKDNLVLIIFYVHMFCSLYTVH